MKYEEIELSTNELTVDLKQVGSFKIETPIFPCPVPFDITIDLFGQKFNFKNFADYYLHKIVNGKGDYKPLLNVVIEDNSKPFCALIGFDEVVFIDIEKKSADKILQMYRKETDDAGFYRLNVKVRNNSFLVCYESGVALIDASSNVAWHKPMRWDDLLIKSDDSYLFYSSEYRGEGEEWRLDIESGAELDGW
jgi:hypothetical protein